MRASWKLGVAALLVVATFLLWAKWKRDEPRRECFAALQQFDSALRSPGHNSHLDSVVLPAAIQGRTTPEQVEFLTKALADEISPGGLAVLQREGAFGSLTNLFPAEAEKWAKQAGVNPADCMAFKLERNGQRAEVVLTKPSALNSQPSTPFRIVRCNNVKQLAQTRTASANSRQ
jgi:hypothetical protein